MPSKLAPVPADAFALSPYDALFVVERALRVAGNPKDFASFKSAFADAANSYSGVTGSTALDAAGDRLSADFDFWGGASSQRHFWLGPNRRLYERNDHAVLRAIRAAHP
jgi:ABC-type branched-subunit amino acid transport system substrate-binding protein